MKKLIITLIVLAVIVAGTIVGVKIYKDHRKNSNPVKCTNVSYLNSGYYEYGDVLDGNITETGEQKVYVSINSIVAEVNVEPGQKVNVGDKLLSYDMTKQQLVIDKMKTQLEVYRTDILMAEKELEKLENMTPLEDMTTETTTEVTTEETTQLTTENTTENTTEDTTEKPTEESGTPTDAGRDNKGDNTANNPGNNSDNNNGNNNSNNGNGTDDNSGKQNPEDVFREHPDWVMYPDGSFGPIQQDGDSGNTDDPMDPNNPNNQFDPNENDEPVYTRAVLKEMILSKKESIKKMKNNLEIYEISIQKEEKKLSEGSVYATINGVVQSVDFSEETISMGQPVIVVSPNSGYQTVVSVSEWKLDKINIGDPVSIYSYESGGSYTGKVALIEKTPTEDYGYYYGGATASRYPVTIVIDEPCDDLAPGYWVQVTMGENNSYDPYNRMDEKVYLPLPYVREENGNSYVLCNENGRLKKRYVKTGKIIYGYAVEIKSGLTMDDYITFPYGKDVEEGKKCINSEGYDDMIEY